MRRSLITSIVVSSLKVLYKILKESDEGRKTETFLDNLLLRIKNKTIRKSVAEVLYGRSLINCT